MTRPTAARAFHIVAPPPEPPAPDLSYEWRERQRIHSKDWSAIHTIADKRAFMAVADVPKRIWRG